MCALDRRSFIKGVSSGILVGALAPGMNLMAATPPSERRKSASFYPALNFDVIVVGAGPGGIPAAIRAAQAGAKVAFHLNHKYQRLRNCLVLDECQYLIMSL